MNLYRYISFEEFVRLLTVKKLHFVNPMKWQDTYEGALFKALKDKSKREELLSKLLSDDNTPISINKAKRAMRNYCKLVFAEQHWYGQCWTCEQEESDALWRIYSYGNHAVRIATTEDRMNQLLPEETYYKRLQPVKYDDVPEKELVDRTFQETLQGGQANEAFFHKRLAFAHEKEFRFLIARKDELGHPALGFTVATLPTDFALEMKKRELSDPNHLNKDEWISILEGVLRLPREVGAHYYQENGEDVSVLSPKELIGDVLVHPMAPEWYVEIVEQLCKDYELPFSGESTLYSSPCC